MYGPADLYDDESDDGFEEPISKIPVRTDISASDKEEKVKEAASIGDLKGLKKILENGSNININQCLNGTWTALMYATFNVQFEVIQYLLNAGADPNAHSASFTPLHCVCSYKGQDEDVQLQCMRFLVGKGALINIGDKYGVTPLMNLVEMGRVRVVEALIALGANLEMRDSQGWTAIFWAVNSGHIESIMLLIEKGARLQEIDKKGRQLIDLTPFDSYQPIVDLLKTPEDKSLNKPQLLREMKTWNDFFPGIAITDTEPEYCSEIPIFLYGMHCEHLIPLFAKEKLSLRIFLLLDEDTMMKIGVNFQYERKRIMIGLRKFHQAKWEVESVAGLTVKSLHFDIMETLNTLGSHMRQLYILEATIQYSISNFVKCPGGVEEQLEVDEDLKKAGKQLFVNFSNLKKEIKKLKMDLQKMQSRNPPPADLIRPNHSGRCYLRQVANIIMVSGMVYVAGIVFVKHLGKLKMV